MDNKECTAVFGVKYKIAQLDKAVQYVKKSIEELKGKYVCFSNVHTLVMARENKEYADVLNGAALVYPDGEPIARIQKKRGFNDAQRIAGPDFMEQMFKATQDGNISHFFYGSRESTLKLLRENLEKNYPGINIKGMYSPPFRALSKEEDERDAEMINRSGADILWVGLGAPKQEKWMKAHEGKINAVMMGVGAGFDFHAGTIKRAPLWMRKHGLEWLFRLFSDPIRLSKRYFVTNAKFIYYCICDTIRKE